MKKISAVEFNQKVASGSIVSVVDVRTPAEFSSVQLPGSHNMPLGQFDPAKVAGAAKEGAVYLMCRTQRRAEMAWGELNGKVDCELVVVEGGIESVDDAHLQRTQTQVMSLERQVRIAAGGLVLSGVVGGFLLTPMLFGLSGFVGAGLVFTGITDNCVMGLIIAKMPWNKA